jgi:hypothetical protein
MSFTAVLYTSLGGVIGAGLTQYITHIRDRRTARAEVLEKVASVEAQYRLVASLRSNPSDGRNSMDLSALNTSLASVEAACLIAGVPRIPASIYVLCRQTGGLHITLRRYAAWAAAQLDRQARAVQDGVLDVDAGEIRKSISALNETCEALASFGELILSLNQASLDELSRSLWHPLRAQGRRLKLHKLQRDIETVGSALRIMEGHFAKMVDMNSVLEA